MTPSARWTARGYPEVPIHGIVTQRHRRRPRASLVLAQHGVHAVRRLAAAVDEREAPVGQRHQGARVATPGVGDRRARRRPCATAVARREGLEAVNLARARPDDAVEAAIGELHRGRHDAPAGRLRTDPPEHRPRQPAIARLDGEGTALLAVRLGGGDDRHQVPGVHHDVVGARGDARRAECRQRPGACPARPRLADA